MVFSFFRVLKFAVQDFYRNFWLSVVTITVLMLALFSVNILIGLNAVSSAVIDEVEKKVDINLEMTSEAADAEIQNFQAFVENIDGVATVEHVSKDQVLSEYRESNKDEPLNLEALDELGYNPFTARLVVNANETSDYVGIIEEIQQSEYERLIENKDFSDPQKVIAIVESITDKTKRFGIILTLIFSFIALLIVFNTIRVTIYTHKEEIGVMRLVGATNWFIRTPYLIEGVLFSLIAMAIMIAMLYGVLQLVQPYLIQYLQTYGFDLIAYYNQNFIKIFGLELLIVIVLNVASSGFAIRKYLKV